jgi:hypothetical protein
LPLCSRVKLANVDMTMDSIGRGNFLFVNSLAQTGYQTLYIF